MEDVTRAVALQEILVDRLVSSIISLRGTVLHVNHFRLKLVSKKSPKILLHFGNLIFVNNKI